ncbi:serine/threonine-protein kinase [Marinicella rhabdoformis]|uniref:serine/threonine-protein kinase n=1 Tax=Marinicella rhabdoformis TaxID=2580566 RepID=UPI0012AED8F0|nr:serine/threonine-protein kinase [Marinicella rhabdoformis]
MDKNDIIKKALLLETQDRTAFLEGINDPEMRQKVAFILNDDTELTSFVLNTAAADVAMDTVLFNDLKPGHKINHITIKSLIGKGGMGNVYLGYDETLKRNVAIKTIRPEFLANPSTQQRFMQEAQILSQINHPAICQIYDYIESDSGNLLVLEWIDGKMLSQQNLPPKDALKVLEALASALHAAHEKGIIHRDLKPDNIMITADHQVKVLDFGIAQSVSDLNKDHSPIGTLRYMSPEQANGDAIGLFSDIYAFGLIMSEVLSKEDCYRYHDTESLMNQVAEAQVHVPTDIKKPFKSIISQCVAKDASIRPTAQQLQLHLNKLQSSSFKHWLTAGLIILLSASAVLGLHFWNKYQASLAFAHIDSRIDSLHLRQGKIETLPAHDTTIKNKALAEQGQDIRTAIASNTTLSNSQKLYLSGQLAYFNRNYSQAIEQLKDAFELQPENRDLAHLYLLALSQNYFQILSQNIEDTSLAQQENSQLSKAQKQLELALNEINQIHNFKNHAALPLLEATNHIIASEYDAAIAAVVTKTSTDEGQYAPFYLAGIIKRQQGLAAYFQGQYAASLTFLDQSMQHFKKSNDLARSYMGNYYEFCYLGSHILKVNQHHSSDVKDHYQEAIDLCQQGLTIDPNDQFIMGQLATINWRYGQWLLTHGQRPDDYFQQSLQWGERSLAVSESADAWTNQGIVYDLIALQKLEAGINPEKEITQALAAYDKVNILNPALITSTTGNQLYAYNILSQFQVLKGEEVSETGLKALDLIAQATKHPQFKTSDAANIYNNFAYIALLAAFSEFDFKRDPQIWLNHAKDYYSRVETELGNKSIFAIAGLAETYWFEAEVGYNHGLDDSGSIEAASKHIDEALALSRQYYWMPLSKSKILMLKVKSSLSKDVTADMALAKTLIDESVALNAKYAETHVALSYWHYLQIQATDLDAENKTHYQMALASADKALVANAHTAQAYLLKAALTKLAQDKGIPHNHEPESIQTWKRKAKELNPHARLWPLPQ